MLTTTSPEGAPAAQPPQQQQLGLQQSGPARVGGNGGVRKAATKPAIRKGPVWGSVKILNDHDMSPQVECNFCGVKFCGGATRIKEHLCDKCTDDSPEFLALKESLLGEKGEIREGQDAGGQARARGGCRVCPHALRTLSACALAARPPRARRALPRAPRLHN